MAEEWPLVSAEPATHEALDERLRVAARLDVDDLVELGCDLAEAGRLSEAEMCFRACSDAGSAIGSFNLGNALAEQERWLEAVTAYELALQRDESDAWLNLGVVLHELGDLAGEIRAYRAAEAAGDTFGTLSLAFALRELGERDAAMEAAERAAACGNDTAAAAVACWQWCTSLDPALEPALRAGADHFPATRADLGDLLIGTGRIQEARTVFELGVALGEIESMVPLGNLCKGLLDDAAAAEAAYRAGVAHGDPHAHHNLAVLLTRRRIVVDGESGHADDRCHRYTRDRCSMPSAMITMRSS